MALPIDYDTVKVTGKYVYLDGTPATGTVTFTGKTTTVSATTNTVIIPSTITVSLDVLGSFTIFLPATDDPDIMPQGWTYKVEERFDGGGGRTFDMDVSITFKNVGIDISDILVPGTPSFGDPNVFPTLSYLEERIRSKPPVASGKWRSVPGPSVGLFSLGAGLERAGLTWFVPGQVFNAIAVNVGATVAATNVRLGIRADNDGVPGAVLLDAGTVPATMGLQQLTINFTVPAGPNTGIPLWLCAAAQGNAVSLYAVTANGETRDPSSATTANSFRGGMGQSGVNGALPNTFTPSSTSSTAIAVAMRAA